MTKMSFSPYDFVFLRSHNMSSGCYNRPRDVIIFKTEGHFRHLKFQTKKRNCRFLMNVGKRGLYGPMRSWWTPHQIYCTTCGAQNISLFRNSLCVPKS